MIKVRRAKSSWPWRVDKEPRSAAIGAETAVN
jgi:hypothetical protein